MKLKKLLALALASLMILATLTACGGGDDAGSDASSGGAASSGVSGDAKELIGDWDMINVLDGDELVDASTWGWTAEFESNGDGALLTGDSDADVYVDWDYLATEDGWIMFTLTSGGESINAGISTEAGSSLEGCLLVLLDDETTLIYEK